MLFISYQPLKQYTTLLLLKVNKIYNICISFTVTVSIIIHVEKICCAKQYPYACIGGENLMSLSYSFSFHKHSPTVCYVRVWKP